MLSPRGESLRAIARRLGRAASTVSREVADNKGRHRYRAIDAHDRAWYRARRPKRCLVDRNEVLASFVAEMLRADWYRQHISGFLAVMHPPGSEMRVSHETIYKRCSSSPEGPCAGS